MDPRKERDIHKFISISQYRSHRSSSDRPLQQGFGELCGRLAGSRLIILKLNFTMVENSLADEIDFVTSEIADLDLSCDQKSYMPSPTTFKH